MIKKYLTFFLVGLVINLSFSAVAFAQTQSDKDAKRTAKVKTKIAKLGTGTDAKVKVKLKDGTKVKGYITEVKENSFVVMNEKTSTTSEMAFSQVKEAQGKNIPLGVRIAVGVGTIVGLLALTGFLVHLSGK